MRRHMRTRSRCRVAAVLVVTGALLVASCGGDDGGSSGQSSSDEGEIDETAVLRIAGPIADQGGVSFDPANMAGYPGATQWMDLIYDVMIHDTPDGEGAPGLATEWTAIDGSTAELTLREGVTFSDGTPFNAEAVAEAWNRAIEADQSIDPIEVRAMTNVEAVDENTVRVHFNEPVAQTFLDSTVHHSLVLGVPSPTAAAAGDLNSDPVGAGPYVLEDFTQDQQVVLAQNPEYWDPDAQLLAGFEFTNASDGAPTVSALQSGTADMIGSVPADAVDTIESDPNFEITSKPGTRILDFSLCATRGVLENQDARLALQYAIDRDAINEGAYSGTAEPWQTVFGPSSPYFDEELNQTYTHDVEMARELLEEAGVEEGTTITGLANSAEPQPVIAEIVKDQLEEVGLNLDYTVTTNLVDDANRVQPDLVFAALDPQFLPIAFSGATTPLNVCGWTNEQVASDLLAFQDPTLSDAEREAAADQFQQTILEESPVIVTVLSPVTVAHTTRVKGLETFAVPFGPNLNTVYMTT